MLHSRSSPAEDSNLQPETTASAAFEFDVFISYSRRDNEFAGALERALRAYKPPAGLGLPESLLRVFRDQSDLRGPDYDVSIRAHLARSRKLLLVCSPASSHSKYVNDEVAIFAGLRGAEHLVPLLSRGIPNNETTPATEAERAFPPALVDAIPMPLAIDYRGRDIRGNRISKGENSPLFFSLLANIYDLPRDRIEQRELRRRRRSRNRWTAFLSSIGVALLSLTVWALLSAAEAKRQAGISRAGELTATAGTIGGMDLESAQRRALVAAEAVARNAALGVYRRDAVQTMADSISRLPRLALTFDSRKPNIPVAFSGDGQAMFVAREKSVERWLPGGARMAGRAMLADEPAMLIAGSTSDEIAVVSGSGDLEILRSWDEEADTPRARPSLAKVRCAAFDREHTRLAVVIQAAAGRQEIQVRDLPSLEIRHRLEIPAGSSATADDDLHLPCQELSPGNREPAILLTRLRSDGEMGTWGGLALRLPSEGGGFLAELNKEKFAPMGTLITLPSAAAYLRHWRGGERLQFVDGPLLDGEARLLEFGDRVALTNVDDWKPEPPQGQGVAAVSPNGKFYVSIRSIGEDPYVPLLDSSELEIRATADGLIRAEVPGGGSSGWQFSRDSRSLIAVHGNLVRYFSVERTAETYRINARQPPRRVLEAPGSRFVALQAEDGSLDVWDVGHAQEIVRLPDADKVEISGQGQRIAAIRGRLVEIVDRDPSAAPLTLRFPGRPTAARWSDDARQLALVSSPGPLELIGNPHLETFAQLYDLSAGAKMSWTEKGVFEVAFHSDGRSMLTIGKDGAVSLKSLPDSGAIWSLRLPGAVRARFSPRGDVLALTVDPADYSSPIERGIVLLDPASGARLGSIAGSYRFVDFDPTGKFLVLAPEKGAPVIREITSGTSREIPLLPEIDTVLAAGFSSASYLTMLASAQSGSFLGARIAIQEAALRFDLEAGTTTQQLPYSPAAARDYREILAQEDVPHLVNLRLSSDATHVGATLYPSKRAYWQLAADRVRKDAAVWDVRQADPRQVFRQPDTEVAAVTSGGAFVLTTNAAGKILWKVEPDGDFERVCRHLRQLPDAARWKVYLGGEPNTLACP